MKDVAPVLTPEKVVLTYPIAGLSARILAQILDFIVIVAVLIGMNIVLSIYQDFAPGVAESLVLVLAVALPTAYFALFEMFWSGRTLGKRAFRLRVVMQDGTPVTPYAALFRNLLRPADMLPGFPFVGLMSMFLTPRFQRVGDLAVGTIVVTEPLMGMKFTPAPYKYGIHPFEQHIGNLRGMTMNDYIVLKRLCDRFPFLTEATQAKLLKEIWKPFAEKQKINDLPNVHPIYLMEAVVMKYGRQQELV